MREPRDVSGDDLAARPWAYPGCPVTVSGRIEGGRFTPLPPERLRAACGDVRADVAFVVAVGSNASPGVLSRKLAAGGVAEPVVMLTARLRGCAVGHSAHVSAPGFVAAAPYVAPAADTSVVALLLDDAQTACLDATEPNYVRRTLAGTGPVTLTLDSGETPERFCVYDSVWGVLAPPGEPPLPLTSQRALHDLLRAQSAAYADNAPLGRDLADTLSRLSVDRRRRERVREGWRASGWARRSGLAQLDVTAS